MVIDARRGQRRGASRLGCVIQLAIVVAIIYFGAYAGQDLLDYYRFQDAMKQEARFASKRSDTQIKDRLRMFADSVGLPVAAQDINIVRDELSIHIWSEYDQPLRLPFDWKKSIHLVPSVSTGL
ncbi:MAG TPA: hypothetical protein VII02_11285 [Gemmatimonadaceae bacterium]|jgi:hypothetical protein